MSVPDKAFIRAAFDSITPRYDMLNQVLSFGMSETWRKRSTEIVLSDPSFSPKTILDLGCGTGKFLESFLKKKSWESAIGAPATRGHQNLPIVPSKDTTTRAEGAILVKRNTLLPATKGTPRESSGTRSRSGPGGHCSRGARSRSLPLTPRGG